jgi:hypothetical protein
LLYTNGVSIFHLSPEREKTCLHKGALIQQVVALPPGSSLVATEQEEAQSVGESV